MNSLCSKKLLSLSSPQHADLIQYFSLKRNLIVITNFLTNKKSESKNLFILIQKEKQYISLNFLFFKLDSYYRKKTLYLKTDSNLKCNYRLNFNLQNKLIKHKHILSIKLFIQAHY